MLRQHIASEKSAAAKIISKTGAIMKFWLIKSEPSAYSYNDLEREGRTAWDGVRNYQARNFLRAMQEGDAAVYYHSTEGLAAVGVARIVRECYQDPTTDDDRWVCVDVEPHRLFPKPVPLAIIKSDNRLENIGLVRQSQLSVMPLTEQEFFTFMELSGLLSEWLEGLE